MKLRLTSDGTWFNDDLGHEVGNHVVLGEIDRLRAEREAYREAGTNLLYAWAGRHGDEWTVCRENIDIEADLILNGDGLEGGDGSDAARAAGGHDD